MQQVEAGLNLTVVLTSDGQCFQMGETGASGRVKWDGCKEPELVSHACLLLSCDAFQIRCAGGVRMQAELASCAIVEMAWEAMSYWPSLQT